MKHFRITKHFRGGKSVFYASMKNSQKIRHGYWEDQLGEWGENTNGGHEAGYRIYCNRCESLPRRKTYSKLTHNRLRFNPIYLRKKP